MRPASRAVLAVAAGLALGCAGLFGPVRTSDEVRGRPPVDVPSPSSALARGFADPAARARVADALCFGERAVWARVEQAVLDSLRRGEVHGDVSSRYARLVGTCDHPGYCAWARERIANSDGEIQAFWEHVLATCGAVQDRPRYRDLDADARMVATFYTAGTVPVFRDPADDGALILATERLVRRGADDPVLRDAIWALLRLDDPEPAEALAPLVADAPLDVADELLKGLAGQSAPAAVEVVTAACRAHPGKAGVCVAEPKPARPSPPDRWVAALFADPDPDQVAALLDAHPEWRDLAAAHAQQCGAPCAPAASLVAGDTARVDRLVEAGVAPRADRQGTAAFTDTWAHALHGMGRLARLAPTLSSEQVLARLGRVLELDPAEFAYREDADDQGRPEAAVEHGGTRYAVRADPGDLDALITLVNHVARQVDHPLHLVALPPEGQVRQVAALTDEAEALLAAEGAIPAEPE